ncbi:MAG TPA: hypothetical protein ENJ00_04950 [Phycisphaerales bacterium]|nr:hypothetical protein [Phycisphaerales bacterium]
MTGTTLSRYHALFETVRARSRSKDRLKGADQLVAWGALRLRQRRSRIDMLIRWADRVDAMAPEIRAMPDRALDAAVEEVRGFFVRQRASHDQLLRAVAVVREVASRETGEEAYPVQVAGALALLHGRIAEMVTGEGKTLTGSLAAPILAWRYRHVHVFTVNDYLAARDAESRGGIYRRCGLSSGAIVQEQSPEERARIYASSIVHGTPKQITADYLRDQIRMGRIESAWTGWHRLGSGGPMVPGLQACLVDEADAVLIDEGVTPLIIARSRQEDELAEAYRVARRLADDLIESTHYSIDRQRKRCRLKPAGSALLATKFDELGGAVWSTPRRGEELVTQALTATHCYIRGQQYEVVDGRVVIVDEYTGRFLPDRSWEHGLHQSVEAKEDVEITADRETLARMSFQRFFRSYQFLCGMTGTIAEAAGEMERIYGRPVTVIPTNKPIIRTEEPMRIFRSADAKWAAVVETIRAEHERGRPVLVGTRSVEASQLLSDRLNVLGLTHGVLNAHHHEEEAELIAGAGKPGAITVATNMAGRGTDIKLTPESREAGGLFVILTEIHSARRIDRQFIGRSGRQGDPGGAQIFVSLDDELIRHQCPRLGRWLAARARFDELTGSRLAAGVFRVAQTKSQARDRRGRASVLRQDDWIDRYMPAV